MPLSSPRSHVTRPRRRTPRARPAVLGPATAGLACLVAVVLMGAGCAGSGATPEPVGAPVAAAPPAQDAAFTGKVERIDRAPRPLPDGWTTLEPVLGDAVAAAGEEGYAMAVCARALDTADEPTVCAGDDVPRYAASVIKIAYAVAALEAWDADTDADTPFGPLGELLRLAVSVSDNDAADSLFDLSVLGPRSDQSADPVRIINSVGERVGLSETFHTGGDFRGSRTDDWSHVSARGSVDYVAELVRAADGRAGGDRALTSPRVAREVLAAMSDQERTWKLPAYLPAGSSANKTGETDDESHDIAVINTASGRYAVAVVATADPWTGAPDEITAALGRDIVDLLGGPAEF